STNLLPIRRLGLAVGEEAEVKAAWLRFPGFALEPLGQVYRRISDQTYRYESAGGAFTTELPVNATGFVIAYPGFWTAEAVT
ncbi:MAG TPA: putative glycolipid-binding domain-containing protein, partial [Methylomirabilota bacterium]|nr:putative glycolipid-binding domain-containing protein [Methylomirabilota bacterium]